MFSTENLFSLDWKSVSSLVATIVFLRSFMREFIPPEISRFLKHWTLKLFSSLQTKMSIVIDECDSYYSRELFDSIQAYLSTKSFSSVNVLKLQKPNNTNTLTFIMEPEEKIVDTFQGIPMEWTLHVNKKETNGYIRSRDTHRFKLSFNKKHKHDVNSMYIPFVIEEAARIKFKNRERRIYTNSYGDHHDGSFWSKVPFSHPSSFETLALDPELKEELKADLSKFVERKEFYSRVGRAWKRGYLLYGPPGTGKTSLIAAIANFLDFDIYDLELTSVTSNSQLRKLLIGTPSKSVIVVEDVDCTLDLSDRKKEEETQKKEKEGEEEGDEKKKKKKKSSSNSTVSLSGVLNFVDGLWSSCAGERLMIFTTNHKEKIDPALLRPGRMDKHIHMGFCGFKAFKILAKNYLLIDDHELMKEVEAVLPTAEMTPADIAEILMSCNDDVELGMRNVVEEMKTRKAAVLKRKQEMEEKIEMEKEMVVTEDDPAVKKKLEPKMEKEDKVEELKV